MRECLVFLMTVLAIRLSKKCNNAWKHLENKRCISNQLQGIDQTSCTINVNQPRDTATNCFETCISSHAKFKIIPHYAPDLWNRACVSLTLLPTELWNTPLMWKWFGLAKKPIFIWMRLSKNKICVLDGRKNCDREVLPCSTGDCVICSVYHGIIGEIFVDFTVNVEWYMKVLENDFIPIIQSASDFDKMWLITSKQESVWYSDGGALWEPHSGTLQGTQGLYAWTSIGHHILRIWTHATSFCGALLKRRCSAITPKPLLNWKQPFKRTLTASMFQHFSGSCRISLFIYATLSPVMTSISNMNLYSNICSDVYMLNREQAVVCY